MQSPGDPDLLFHGDRLLIRSVRRMALGTPCEGLRGHFEAACGCAGEAAYRMLEAFVQQLGAKGRRRLALSVPEDDKITEDEGVILEVFACAQAEDYRGLDARLIGLLGRGPPAALGAAACFVAETLALNGLMLKAPVGEPTPVLLAAE